MRFAVAAAIFSAVLSAGAVTLQARQGGFPTCANTCVANPPNLFGCDISDNACLCNNQQYVDATTACIEKVCKPDDAAAAEALSRSLCAQVGVTLSTTATSSPTPTSPAPSAASQTGSDTSNTGSATSPPGTPSPTTTNGAVSVGANAFLGAAALFIAAVNL